MPHPIASGLLAVLFTATAAFGQQLALIPNTPDCPFQEPDSVQISWVQPCEEGDWLLDTEVGCRMWDWHPDTSDKAAWTGRCPAGQKEGFGVVQWTEHGQFIDRFEGTFRAGKREGRGRYSWNATDRFDGHYANDVPDGQGVARLAGEVFEGEWKAGCFKKGDRVVAIGVSRQSCSTVLPGPSTASR
ncbi:MAG: hypothetical protein NTV97_33310 [Alphaproteobacteria bacterium]|nr:hypothetical protein [Alphaproteobacteria bacterium]